MRYVSTFSGIEAASVAWEPLGWEPLAFCEIDAFPSAVLAERYPGVPNLGDIREVDWKKFRGKADLVVGGSPCQSFSVAGKREGLKGESGLMLEYVRAVREVRPRWLLWENVPGALSSEHGEAFRCLLSALDELGYGLAWRVLDAQFFGVAQRRRRLFVVGRLGACPPVEVLLEPDGMRGDSPTSRGKRQELARAAGFGAAGEGCDCLNPWGVRSKRVFVPESCGPTLSSGTGEGKNIVPSVCHAASFAANQRGEVRLQGGDGDVFGAIPTAWSGKRAQGVAVSYAFSAGQSAKAGSIGLQPEQSPTLRAGESGTNMVPTVVCLADDDAKSSADVDMCGSLKVGGAPSTAGTGWEVRRLTPRECERLQGFPDDWTRIPWRGKPAEECPDAPRYKAIGNSMAVPVMRWIGERIEEAD